MKAILINPFTKTVTGIDMDYSVLENIYEAIDAECFDVAYNRGGVSDCIYVDDVGLVSENQMEPDGGIAGFILNGFNYDNPLVGRGLLGGYNNMGQSVDVHSDIEEVRKHIVFLKLYPR